MVRIDDSSDEVKCWLDFPSEIELLEDRARSKDWEREIAIQLMSRVGCRVSGVLSAKPCNLQWNSKGEYWEIEIKGKNTEGGAKKTRLAYVPDEVKRNLDRYASERDIEDSQPYLNKSKATIRRWVREARDDLAEEYGSNWKYVSSHDLRRSWATYHLVERAVNVRVMMEIGGWSDYQSIEPYLGKPTPNKIAEEMG